MHLINAEATVKARIMAMVSRLGFAQRRYRGHRSWVHGSRNAAIILCTSITSTHTHTRSHICMYRRTMMLTMCASGVCLPCSQCSRSGSVPRNIQHAKQQRHEQLHGLLVVMHGLNRAVHSNSLMTIYQHLAIFYKDQARPFLLSRHAWLALICSRPLQTE